jgi:hypothetical protein
MAAFAAIFIIPAGRAFFSLTSIWTVRNLLVWIPLTVTIPVLFFLLRNLLSNQIAPRIAWRS